MGSALMLNVFLHRAELARNSLRANLDKNLNLPKARVVYKSKRPLRIRELTTISNI